ncbi:MAG: HAD hydrolase family protein [Planctomycetota bacterium]|nr:HAD hydrolase family protein [Planctomycetota bacterium]
MPPDPATPRAAPRAFDAIVCDIDGCLAPESSAPLDAPALARLAEHNVRAQREADRPVLSLCSGRPGAFVECLCRLLSNTSVPCVAEMGVWLFDPRVGRFEMDPGITPAHVGAVREATAWVERELVPRGVMIQPGKSASLSLWHADREWLFAQKARLAEVFAREGWPLRVSSTVAWVNCDLAHVNKDTGIARAVAGAGLTKARLAGIGDTLGDLAIRESVGWFACPANAAPELKARADYVSPHAEIEGVLDILTHLPRG